MKAQIVSRDELETGDRALLNLGHTFGHALEAATDYSSRLLHGEGVAIGMTLAFELSNILGLCEPSETERLRRHLKAVGLPVAISDIPGDRPTSDAVVAHMEHDKKVRNGAITLVLVRRIGEAFATSDVPADAIHKLLDA
jgi:3-dehydroquinate synthase